MYVNLLMDLRERCRFPGEAPALGPLELQTIPEQGLEGAFSPRDRWLERNEFPESKMCNF